MQSQLLYSFWLSQILIMFGLIKPYLAEADIKFEMPQSMSYSWNMFATDNDDPLYLGRNVPISTSNVELVHSATFRMDLEFIVADDVISHIPNEFALDFTLSENNLIVQINRIASAVMTGKATLFEVKPDFSKIGPSSGLGFGELKFVEVQLQTMTDLKPKIQNGSWYVQTDLAGIIPLNIMSNKNQEPLEGIQIRFLGINSAQNLFIDDNLISEPTDKNGETYILYQPDPHLLYKSEVNGCIIPKDSVDLQLFLKTLEPNGSFNYDNKIFKVNVSPQMTCNTIFFPRTTIELSSNFLTSHIKEWFYYH